MLDMTLSAAPAGGAQPQSRCAGSGCSDHAGGLAVGANRANVARMTAHEVIDQIKSLPPDEKNKVVEFVQREIEERLLSEETPAMLTAIDEGVRSLDEKGGREYTRPQLEQKVRQWARGGSR